MGWNGNFTHNGFTLDFEEKCSKIGIFRGAVWSRQTSGADFSPRNAPIQKFRATFLSEISQRICFDVVWTILRRSGVGWNAISHHMKSLKKLHFDGISFLFQPKIQQWLFISAQCYQIEKVQQKCYTLSIYIIRVSRTVYNLQKPSLIGENVCFNRLKRVWAKSRTGRLDNNESFTVLHWI